MNLHMPPVESVAMRNILGTQVAALTREEAVALLIDVLKRRHFTRLAFLNAHNANIACDGAGFRQGAGRLPRASRRIGVDIASRMIYGDAFAEPT
jgi:UDP-N-acetyl-D-mannosaminuronic acid transferase (WecB/TagA/CpsF family)